MVKELARYRFHLADTQLLERMVKGSVNMLTVTWQIHSSMLLERMAMELDM